MELRGAFSGGQLDGIHCTRLPPPPLVEITHACLPAFLSPHPKQTESNKREFDTRGNFLSPCRLDGVVASKKVHYRSSQKRFLVGSVVYLPSNHDLSLSFPLAFIGLMNSIVISTANCAAWHGGERCLITR